jgi:hypothetical protein
MTWVPKDKEIEALLSADAKRRYEYFIRRVCETRKVWCLYDEGWASFSEGERKLMPFWPHETYAAHFKTGEWSSFLPQAIELEEFIKEWIPCLKKEGLSPAIFPASAGAGIVLDLEDLEADLRYELSETQGEDI